MSRISEIPKKVDINIAYSKAYKLLIRNAEKIQFPLNPERFFHGKLILLPWTEACKINNTSDFALLKKYKAEARTLKSRGSESYLTVYDDTLTYPSRIRFTIAHELGHIILGHLDKYTNTALNRGGLTKQEYQVLEDEADHFASQLLSPVPLLLLLNLGKINHLNRIMNLFGISFKAARNRIIDIAWYGNSPIYTSYLPTFIYHFQDIVDIYTKGYRCETCKNIVLVSQKYCSICGNTTVMKIDNLTFGRNPMIYNDGYKLNDYSKAIFCPVCQNEEILEGEYCKICGSHIVNKCTSENCRDYFGNGVDCDLLADGNARFCHKCGSPTTFFQNMFLEPWEKVKEIEKEQNKNVKGDRFLNDILEEGFYESSDTSYDPLSVLDDDELPF